MKEFAKFFGISFMLCALGTGLYLLYEQKKAQEYCKELKEMRLALSQEKAVDISTLMALRLITKEEKLNKCP